MRIIKCMGCGGEFESIKFPSHARRCELYLQERQKRINKLTYEFLYHEYVEEEKSTCQIAREAGLGKGNIVSKKLKEYNIKERTFVEGRKAKGYRQLCQKTSMEKYGVPYHTMKESPIREKINQGVKDKYGEQYNNVFQVPEIKEKIHHTIKERYDVDNISQHKKTREKIKHTCIQKYNTDNPSKSPIVKAKIKKTTFEHLGCESPFQLPETKQKLIQSKKDKHLFSHSLKAEKFFKELFVDEFKDDDIRMKPNTKEFYLRYDKKTVYRYDFTNITRKKIIEFNGSYWHANPKKYSSDWVNATMKMTAQQIWDRDEKKIQFAKSKGFDVLVIWDEDVKNNKQQEVEKCLSFLRGF